MRLVSVLLALAASIIVLVGVAVPPNTKVAAEADPQRQISEGSPRPRETITSYTLTPERARKAHQLHLIYFWFSLLGFGYGLLVLWALLRAGIGSSFRTLAERISARRLVQVVVFTPLLFLALDLCTLPLALFRHWLGVRYGLSISSWSTWLWDWTKAELVTIVGATILIWILYSIIRRNPRRWWLWFWAAVLPLGVILVLLTPLILDPLFHKFEPLAGKDPALTAELQKMIQRAGQDIPPERMFWMGAGEKTTALNAYVTGLGPSKRIVVWDTTITKMPTAEIVFVTAHEMGHYVLQHIPKGLATAALIMLLGFYLEAQLVGRILSRWGPVWGIRGVDDLASFPVLLFVFSLLAFLGNPIGGAISRYYEHQADQYAIEVTHGLSKEPAHDCAQAFQILGDIGLSDPDPLPLDVFLFYDHPPIRERIEFCFSYDPWSKGQLGEFVK